MYLFITEKCFNGDRVSSFVISTDFDLSSKVEIGESTQYIFMQQKGKPSFKLRPACTFLNNLYKEMPNKWLGYSQGQSDLILIMKHIKGIQIKKKKENKLNLSSIFVPVNVIEKSVIIARRKIVCRSESCIIIIEICHSGNRTNTINELLKSVE